MRYNFADDRPLIWLLRWTPTARAHIAWHEVLPEEVEEVCVASPIVIATYAGRLKLIGPTSAGRILTVILEPLEEEEWWYLVTARPSHRKERMEYFEERT